jgi:hypothetical protein
MGDYDANYASLTRSVPGDWADPDMMEVGRKGDAGWVITDDESRAHFSLAAAAMSITQAELGWGTAVLIYVRDLWTHQTVAPFSGTFTKNVATHAVDVNKMSTAPINPPTEMLRKMDRSIAWLAKNGREIFPQRLIPGVMTGFDPRARIFDLRGRSVLAGPSLPGANLWIIRAPASVQPAMKTAWFGK